MKLRDNFKNGSKKVNSLIKDSQEVLNGIDVMQANENEGKIRVAIHDIDYGMRKFSNVKLIRLCSKDYRLMILNDHTPMVGELEGSINILLDKEELHFDNVKGFYLHLNNEFDFIKSEAILNTEKDLEVQEIMKEKTEEE